MNERQEPTVPIHRSAAAGSAPTANQSTMTSSLPMSEHQKWYQQTWVIILLLFFFWPVGIALVWTSKWQKNAKIIVTVAVTVLVVIGLSGMFSVSSPTKTSTSKSLSIASQIAGSSSSSSSSSAASADQTSSAADSIPIEYKNALNKAQQYNDTLPMSYEGLYYQLTSEYGEGYSAAAARYAVDNVNADWNANALKTARSYQELNKNLSLSAIYARLIDEYDGQFTKEQAQYAIDHL